MKLRITAFYYDESIGNEDYPYQDVVLDGPEVGNLMEDESIDAIIDGLQEEHGTIDSSGDSEWFELDLPDERDSKEEAEAACSGLMAAICEALDVEWSE